MEEYRAMKSSANLCRRVYDCGNCLENSSSKLLRMYTDRVSDIVEFGFYDFGRFVSIHCYKTEYASFWKKGM